MDTKLKNMSRTWYVKFVVYLILVGCVFGASFLVCKNMEFIRSANFEVFDEKQFEDSFSFYQEMDSYINAVFVAETYDSVEEIQSGKYEEKVKERLEEPYECWDEANGNVKIEALLDYNEVYYSYEYGAYEEVKDNPDLSFEAFLKENPELEEMERSAYITGLIEEYQQSKELLLGEERFFSVFSTKKEEDNWIKKIETYPLYAYVKYDGQLVSNSKHMRGILKSQEVSNKGAFIAVKETYYKQKTEEWQQQKKALEDLLMHILAFPIIGIFAFLYLVWVTGRRPGEDKVHLYRIDAIWSELYWIAGILAGVGITGLIVVLFNYEVKEKVMFYVWFLMMGAVGTLFMECILAQVRHLKARKFLEGFLCFRILKKGYVILKSSWRRGKLSKRAVFLAILLPILCLTWVGAPFVIAFLIYMIYRYIGDFIEIMEGTKRIKNGKLNYKIQVKNNDGVLGELAEDINSLSKGLDAAVSNELRSERLKSELISNVSHDLKTPLTSIVTYVDLLKQEEIENETAKSYIDVIDRKTQRLTALTSDLFEAAKASSGDMPVHMEKVDLNAIIRQALGEFDEKIKKANLEIRTNLPEGGAYISADGKLTWRVLENLLSNVVKYGQSNSRVYMEAKEEETEVCFVMKNISAYELNISADELMERFKRGDESRNSEGSGLGLSIANSLVHLQQGRFKIQIDGDLFKVTIHLQRYVEVKE